MDEVWKDVVGYEGLYLVSNLGRVKNIKYRHGSKIASKEGKIVVRDKILKPFPTRKGYMYIELKKLNGEGKTCKVHRLVMDAFTEPHPDMQVNHINGIKSDNRLENLEWVTQSENIRHAIRTGLYIPRNNVCERPKKEVQLLKDGVVIGTYPSIREMCRVNNLNNGNVTSCLNGKRGYKSVNGYTFKLTGRIL